MYHSLQWIFYKYRTLVPKLSVYGAVASRCYQFGLTEEEKGRPAVLDGGTTRSGIVGISSDLAPGNRMQGCALSFQILEKEIEVQLTQL